MKKYLLLLFALILSIPLLAQLEVKEDSFKKSEGFVNINHNIQSDDNDVLYAVIKVKTENINDKQRHELRFEGNAATFIELEYKIGEVWVYLSSKPATYLKISHPDLSSTEFWFPYDLEPKQGYELTLINKIVNTTILSGSLSIITQPENGATITVNGKVISSKTPYINDIIPAGKYEITVSKERYKTVNKIIEINGGEDKKLEIEMPIDVATITLKADIETEIYVDGKIMKKGTWIGELNSGNHEVIYKKKYHRDASQTILVEGGKSQTYELSLGPITGTVYVESTPDDVEVYIDNKKYGLTPIFLNNVLIGDHVLNLKKEGFGAITQVIHITENDSLFINTNLVEVFDIKIKTRGQYDRVYIDGDYVGYAPISKGLSAGNHIIKVVRGFSDSEKTEEEIIVGADSKKEFEILFLSDSQEQTANKQDIYSTSYNYNNRDDRKVNFDIGVFAGLGMSFLKSTNSDDFFLNQKYWGYFAKGLYASIMINKIGLKTEVTNFNASGHTLYFEHSYTYPNYSHICYEYHYNFSTINIPIMIGYETDEAHWFLFSAYIGPQINICNNATYDIIDSDSQATISSNQSIKNYEKTSCNLMMEINWGWCYENISISFISVKFDITKPTIFKNNGTEPFLGNLKSSSFILGMQLDYNF